MCHYPRHYGSDGQFVFYILYSENCQEKIGYAVAGSLLLSSLLDPSRPRRDLRVVQGKGPSQCLILLGSTHNCICIYIFVILLHDIHSRLDGIVPLTPRRHVPTSRAPHSDLVRRRFDPDDLYVMAVRAPIDFQLSHYFSRRINDFITFVHAAWARVGALRNVVPLRHLYLWTPWGVRLTMSPRLDCDNCGDRLMLPCHPVLPRSEPQLTRAFSQKPHTYMHMCHFLRSRANTSQPRGSMCTWATFRM
ncbi:hypothetical protein V8E53_014655 [Lactarius tabidus]